MACQRKGDRRFVLEARKLAVGYDGRVVVGDVDIEALAGRIVVLIGPNGAGKSTVLRTISGHLEPLGGVVSLCGDPLERHSFAERAKAISVLLTERLRTELLTCSDVVEMGRYPHTGSLGILSEADRKAVRDAMELLNVWGLRDCDLSEMSDGQRQRVMLARALCQEPKVLILDEPTGYLDIRYQIELCRLLRRLARERDMGMVMSLHELPLARKVSDYVLCVKDGSVVARGTPDEVFAPEVIDELYDLEPGMFDPATGGVSLEGDW